MSVLNQEEIEAIKKEITYFVNGAEKAKESLENPYYYCLDLIETIEYYKKVDEYGDIDKRRSSRYKG